MSGACSVTPLEKAVLQVQAMVEAAKRESPEVMVLTHGGPFADVETAQFSIIHTDAVGYAAGSSGERIPTENAVVDAAKAFKSMHF